MLVFERYGRLGNSILQLNNAIHIALYFNQTLKLPDHTFLMLILSSNRRYFERY